MKKVIFFAVICLMALTLDAQKCALLDFQFGTNSDAKPSQNSVSKDYTDLGLPSGTIWSNYNAPGFYTYEAAVGLYGSSLPSEKQWSELLHQCKWSWTGSGAVVTGPNGNSIFLPAEGLRACSGSVNCKGDSGWYWSSTPDTSLRAVSFYFSSSSVEIGSSDHCMGQSVRLVQSRR